jgi:hypothetical protein
MRAADKLVLQHIFISKVVVSIYDLPALPFLG